VLKAVDIRTHVLFFELSFTLLTLKSPYSFLASEIEIARNNTVIDIFTTDCVTFALFKIVELLQTTAEEVHRLQGTNETVKMIANLVSRIRETVSRSPL